MKTGYGILTIKLVEEMYDQYIKGERFTCYRAKTKHNFDIYVLISSFMKTEMDTWLNATGYIRTDYMSSKYIVTKLMVIQVEPFAGEVMNQFNIFARLNKINDYGVGNDGGAYLYASGRAIDKYSNSTVFINARDTAARQLTAYKGQQVIVRGQGVLKKAKGYEYCVNKFEEVSVC